MRSINETDCCAAAAKGMADVGVPHGETGTREMFFCFLGKVLLC